MTSTSGPAMAVMLPGIAAPTTRSEQGDIDRDKPVPLIVTSNTFSFHILMMVQKRSFLHQSSTGAIADFCYASRIRTAVEEGASSFSTGSTAGITNMGCLLLRSCVTV